MAPQFIIDIKHIISNEKCYEIVRKLRWPQEVKCPHCHAACITKYGRDETQPARQKYWCRKCGKRFNDLTTWLRPHRGISQEKLPSYLSFFQFVHNVKVRGKRLLNSLIGLLVG